MSYVSNALKIIINVSAVIIPLIFFSGLLLPKLRSKKLLLKSMKSLANFLLQPLIFIFSNKTIKSKIFYILIICIYVLLIGLLVFFKSIMLFHSIGSIIIFTFIVTTSTLLMIYIAFVVLYYAFNLITDYIFGIKLHTLVFVCFFVPLNYMIILIYKIDILIKPVILFMLLSSLIIHIMFIRVLFICVLDDSNLKAISFKYPQYSKYFGILILLLILQVNLYCEVILISSLTNGWAFCMSSNPENHITNWLDLIYYTTITFSTVGYGDIVPYSPAGKIESIIIILSSITFLIVFLGSILSSNKSNSTRKFNPILTGQKKIKRK